MENIKKSQTEKSQDSREKVVERKSTYTEAKKKANKAWNSKQAQIAIRIKPEIKEQIDDHCKDRGESLAAFMVRAALTQIERDNMESGAGV